MTSSLASLTMQQTQSDLHTMEKSLVTMTQNNQSHQQTLVEIILQSVTKRNQQVVEAFMRVLTMTNDLLSSANSVAGR
jgi:hypothetical protein